MEVTDKSIMPGNSLRRLQRPNGSDSDSDGEKDRKRFPEIKIDSIFSELEAKLDALKKILEHLTGRKMGSSEVKSIYLFLIHSGIVSKF